MKRTCEGCRALDTTFRTRCDLGFEISASKQYYGLDVAWKPLEECPKPKTYNSYFYYQSLKSRGKLI